LEDFEDDHMFKCDFEEFKKIMKARMNDPEEWDA